VSNSWYIDIKDNNYGRVFITIIVEKKMKYVNKEIINTIKNLKELYKKKTKNLRENYI
jgi:hypothetical protein